MSEPVTLTFNLSLYDLDAIAEAVGAYEQLAGFVVEESPEQVRVVLTDPPSRCAGPPRPLRQPCAVGDHHPAAPK